MKIDPSNFSRRFQSKIPSSQCKGYLGLNDVQQSHMFTWWRMNTYHTPHSWKHPNLFFHKWARRRGNFHRFSFPLQPHSHKKMLLRAGGPFRTGWYVVWRLQKERGLAETTPNCINTHPFYSQNILGTTLLPELSISEVFYSQCIKTEDLFTFYFV